MLPVSDCEYDLVDRMFAQGKLSIEFLLQDLDDTIRTGYALPHEAKPELKRVFDKAANSAGLLSESALLALLQATTAIPPSSELVEANNIIFSALRYLSNFPFCPNIESGLEGINFAQFSRALAWILPGNDLYMFEEDNFSRCRTPADHRRLLFQCFALRHAHPLYEAPIARKLAVRNAFDYERDFGSNLCAMNYDEDGDEIFHDLLEVLYSSQEQHPPRAPAIMDAFRPLAKRMFTENNLPTLRTLGIPAGRFVTLLRLLLAMQFEPPTAEEEPVHLSHFTTAAVSICAAVAATDTPNLITHPSFDHGLHYLAPYLFDSLFHFLSRTFLGRTTPAFLSGNLNRPSQLPSTPSPDGILTLPLAAQLTTFLCWNADYASLCRHARFTPETPLESASGLIDTLTPPKDSGPPSILLFRGYSAGSSEPVVFGLFTPHPGKDGQAIHDVSKPNVVGNHGCSLFQLSPIHGVFRGTPGKPGWSVLHGEETIVFGDAGAGVSITVTLPNLSSVDGAKGEADDSGKGLGRVMLRQIIMHGEEEDLDETRAYDREEGWYDEAEAKKEREKQGWTYEADAARGDWAVDFEVELIEVWSADE